MKQKTNNYFKGISLIVLIITIIIMVILSGTVIITLLNGNLITQANLTVDINNLATLQEAFEYEKTLNKLDKTKRLPVTVNVNQAEVDDITKSYIVDSQKVAEAWAIDWDKVYYLDFNKIGIARGITISSKDKDISADRLFIVDEKGETLIYNRGILVQGNRYYKYDDIKNITGSEIAKEDLLKNKIFTSLNSQTYVLKENGDVYSVGKITSANLIGQPESMYKDVENTMLKTSIVLNSDDKISIGNHYSFLLKADGKLNVIGSNVYGKLGLGDTVDRYSFNELKLSNVKEAITSTHTSIFLLKNGDVYGSGKNFYEYGPGNYYLIKENGEVTYNTPIKIEGINNVEKILSVTDFGVTVQKKDGSIWGWGSDCFGSFGLGDNLASRGPTEFSTLNNLAISRGTTVKNVERRITTIALLANGEVYTTGYGPYSCLGDGTTTSKNTFTPVPILTNVKEISLGSTHAYALTNDNIGYGWGGNSAIGTVASQNGTVIGIKSPSVIPINNIVKVKDRYALTSEGFVYKLGLNSYNEFNKKYTSSVKIKDIYSEMGSNGAYFIDEDNFIWAFGSVSRNMLLGEYGYKFRALKTAFKNVDTIHANAYNILYKTKDNKLFSAGYNIYASLGLNTNSLTPHAQHVNTTNIPGIKQIDLNSGLYDISYILDNNNRIWNSGDNTYGQSVTTGATNIFTINNKTLPSGNIERIIGKNNNLLIKMTNGKLYGNGYNVNGELGLGAVSTHFVDFREITKDAKGNTINFNNAKVITDRFDYTYMLMNDGTLYSWGNNFYGQLGIGTLGTKEPSIKEVTWFKDNNIIIRDVKTGINFTVFITSDNNVYTVGDNSDGQLGIGNRTSSLIPKKVNIQNVKEIITGDKYVIAVKMDGTVYSWGKNDYGQCGTRTLDDVLTPTRAIELMK